ncbi:glycosyltransferase [Brevundimonas sp. AJA228-03]|uniref:glycosyltransferase n=1 Tax=Brevundimonas sp. AJA228-03 TaxID=2752515 RepID=UPI001ADFC13B|nr:glycosyltransferase [Brevundimonas sp. AJA228-03]QTN20244.1 glycosyltransferase [Brevundimonas sp. AJA228-03]
MNQQRIGDGHRDAREWKHAASAYRKHVSTHPEDAAIWVQLGHALKESGDLAGAEEAYETAVSAAPNEVDAYVHLAHVLKRQDKHTPALEAFRTAAKLGAGDQVHGEIEVLMRSVRSDLPLTRATNEYLFSIQDMFFYLRTHPTMSGIQRVQAGITLALMEMDDVDVGFILTDFTEVLERGSFWLLRNSDVKAMINYAAGAHVDHHRLRKLLSACEHNASPITAGGGNTIVLSGAFWGLDNTIDRYLPAKRAGAKLAAYIYDIIPISHPQYCEAELTREFTTGVGELCLICDYILTISDYTRVILDKFLIDNGGRAVPTATVPLAHSLTGPSSEVQAWPQSMQKLRGREYVTYVSTIEGRKNHAYVVNVWRKLIEQGVDVPDLVFVGRKGWRINGLLDLLDGTRNLGGRVHIVHDLTDAELNAVYENSLFTVFTSFVEGWGLPVGESLMHHIPCAASNTSSIPEVGGDFVDYVDPESIQTGVDVIGRMITDRAYLASRKQNIVDNFKPRGWDDVARLFVAQMKAHAHLPVAEALLPTLAEGLQFRPGDLMEIRKALIGYVTTPSRLMIAENFYGTERWGAWMRGRFGEISFRTPLPEGTPIMVYIGLETAPWYEECRTIVYLGDGRHSESRALMGPEIKQNRHFRLSGFVGPNGVCRVCIEVEGEYGLPEGDTRNFAVGLTGVGYARVSNLEARADLLESFSFGAASVACQAHQQA